MKHPNNSDYYFYAGAPADHNDDPPVVVLICPKNYFDSNGHLMDSHIALPLVIVGNTCEVFGMVQVQESIFHVNYTSIEETREQLLELGFVESDEFSKFCSTHDPFV